MTKMSPEKLGIMLQTSMLPTEQNQRTLLPTIHQKAIEMKVNNCFENIGNYDFFVADFLTQLILFVNILDLKHTFCIFSYSEHTISEAYAVSTESFIYVPDVKNSISD